MNKDYSGKLYDQIKSTINYTDISDLKEIKFWFNLGKDLAEMVDKFKNIEGVQKKELVIELMNKIIKDKELIPNLDDEDREKITFIINTSIPITLDLIIQATKGEIKINKKSFIDCFSKC